MKRFGVKGFINNAVYRLGAHVEDMGPGCVEGHVKRNDIALLEQCAKSNVLRRPSLMGRDHMIKTENLPD